jgi:hypothetical protein
MVVWWSAQTFGWINYRPVRHPRNTENILLVLNAWVKHIVPLNLTVKHLITMSMLSKEMFCLLSIRLVLAHMQLVMSSVSHVQQEHKHEVQQHNSRFASGLNTSEIMWRQRKKLSGCKILSSTWQTWERVSRIKPEEIINYDKITAV